MTSSLFRILRRLDEAKVHYFIERHRPETIDITATFVGCRVEISVFEDDHVEISTFRGNEDVLEEDVLHEIIHQTLLDNELTGPTLDRI